MRIRLQIESDTGKDFDQKVKRYGVERAATRVGVSQSSMSQYVRGKSPIPFRTYLKLLEFVDICKGCNKKQRLIAKGYCQTCYRKFSFSNRPDQLGSEVYVDYVVDDIHRLEEHNQDKEIEREDWIEDLYEETHGTEDDLLEDLDNG